MCGKDIIVARVILYLIYVMLQKKSVSSHMLGHKYSYSI